MATNTTLSEYQADSLNRSTPQAAETKMGVRLREIEQQLALSQRKVAFSVAAEAADEIVVSLTLQDHLGNAIEEAANVTIELLNAELVLLASAAYTAAVDAGALTTNTRAQIRATMLAAGTLDVTVADVVGATDATIYMRVTPDSGVAAYQTLTFDNA